MSDRRPTRRPLLPGASWRQLMRALGNDQAIANAKRSCEKPETAARRVDATLIAMGPDAAPGVTICLELHPGASAYSPGSYRRLAEHAGPNLGVNFDPSHFWWQGIDPFSVIEDVGDRIGFAHGKDTLIHADRVRRDGVIDFRHPVDAATATWHFAAVGDGHDIAAWAELLAALRAAGYDGDLSIEHEDPRMGPDEGIETSLAGLRAALAHPEVAVG